MDRQFAEALDAADSALGAPPQLIWIQSNRVHALMFLGRVDDARALYLKYRGQIAFEEQTPQTWEASILGDFAECESELSSIRSWMKSRTCSVRAANEEKRTEMEPTELA